MEGDIPTDFYPPPSSEGPGDPDEIPLGVLRVAEKAAGLSTWFEFGEQIGQDAAPKGRRCMRLGLYPCQSSNGVLYMGMEAWGARFLI